MFSVVYVFSAQPKRVAEEMLKKRGSGEQEISGGRYLRE